MRAAGLSTPPAYRPVGRRAASHGAVTAIRSHARHSQSWRKWATSSGQWATSAGVRATCRSAWSKRPASRSAVSTGWASSVSQARISVGMSCSRAELRRRRQVGAGGAPQGGDQREVVEVVDGPDAAAGEALEGLGEDRRVRHLLGGLGEAVHAVGERVAGAAAVLLRLRRPGLPCRRRDHQHERARPDRVGSRRCAAPWPRPSTRPPSTTRSISSASSSSSWSWARFGQR